MFVLIFFLSFAVFQRTFQCETECLIEDLFCFRLGLQMKDADVG